MSSFRDLLAKAKSEIREVDTATADDMRRLPGTVLLDVREPDEYEQGALPGALHIPRGHLEIADRGQGARSRHAPRRVLRRWCALGVRGEDARRARIHRRRVDGRWVRPLEGRGSRVGSAHAAQRRPEDPLSAPPPAPRGGRRGPGEAARREGAAPRRRRPRLTGSALPRGRGCRHARHRRHGRRRRVEPAAPDPAQHRPHRRSQGRLGEEDAHVAQPGCERRRLRHSARSRTTSSTSSTATT